MRFEPQNTGSWHWVRASSDQTKPPRREVGKSVVFILRVQLQAFELRLTVLLKIEDRPVARVRCLHYNHRAYDLFKSGCFLGRNAPNLRTEMLDKSSDDTQEFLKDVSQGLF
jgi:hypothetical protein